jgi:hypothetical protein
MIVLFQVHDFSLRRKKRKKEFVIVIANNFLWMKSTIKKVDKQQQLRATFVLNSMTSVISRR